MTTPLFMPDGEQIASQRDFLWEIEGIPGYWKMVSAPKRSTTVTDEFDGGAPEPQALASPPTLDNLTFTRGYRPNDAAPMQRCWDAVGRGRLTVHCHDVDPAGDIITGAGHSRTYPKCLIVSSTDPDTDWSSGTAANWIIELKPTRKVPS